MDMDFKNIEVLDNKREERGYETVWSIWDDKLVSTNDKVVAEDEKSYRVTYTAYDMDMNAYEFSSFTAYNTVEGFWAAAESVFQQAKNQIGDWHVFVEGFELKSDGSYSMVTGS